MPNPNDENGIPPIDPIAAVRADVYDALRVSTNASKAELRAALNPVIVGLDKLRFEIREEIKLIRAELDRLKAKP